MTKNGGWLAFVVGAFCFVAPITAPGAEATVSLDIFSAYIWRGVTLNDGAVLQPSLDVALPGGFGINVWGNFDLDNYGGRLNDGEFSEVDMTLSYSIPIGALDVTVGVVQYTFPQLPGPDASDTVELYASLSYGILAGLSCGMDVYRDVDQMDDYYVSLSLAYARDIAGCLSGELNASAGYAGDRWSASGKSGFHDYSVGLVLTCALGDALSLNASMAVVGSLDEDVLSDDAIDRDFVCGAGVSRTF
jgi:uncharacterized protein (TIGR02001 family)